MACEACPGLQQVLAELREIRALLQPKKCSAADHEALLRLLPAIAGFQGSKPFRVWEIMIDPAIAKIGKSPAAVGGLLSRAAKDGIVICDLQVEKLPRVHNATMWRLTRALVYQPKVKA